ncbi:MAG: protein translocase subunit SecD [bacterium]
MFKRRFWAFILIVLAAAVGYFVYSTNVKDSKYNFKLGLDLNGGTELIYQADTKDVVGGDVTSAMETLRDVIERRVNVFGVSEPVIQVESGERLLVELPGVTNIDEAVKMIGLTPSLEFKLLKKEFENATSSDVMAGKKNDELFDSTGLTGRLLEKSSVEFSGTTGDTAVALQFNSDGAKLFAEITKNNIGRHLAIFLDGDIKSMPVIREEIKGGKASISGGFTGSAGLKEAKTLVNNLNLGALPVPIELISTQTVGASLGNEAVKASMHAGLWAFLIIGIFLIVWYRLPGVLAVIALAIYTAINLALFKLIPVTMTAAGIAGFILSMGMAVDANILIFERTKEELKRGRELGDAIKEGFARAWLSIRDSNISSLITATILFFFSSTPMVKGFALVFGMGVLVSMFSAITATRTLLLAMKHDGAGKVMRFLFSSGISK